MKKKWLIATLLLSVLTVLSFSSALAITNGRDANSSQYPWMALVVVSEDGATGGCGGTLVAPDWVLTAAHCTPSGSDGAMIVVVGGDIDLSQGVDESEIVEVTQWVVHPNYPRSRVDADSDLAMLKLSRPSGNQTISIPQPNNALYNIGQAGKVAGWGLTQSGDRPAVLQEANVIIFPQAHCAIWLPLSVLTNNMFCIRSYDAPYENGSRGDSGGPMFIDQGGTPVQIGITSFGSVLTPFNSYQPAVYVRAANYHSWIYGVINSQ